MQKAPSSYYESNFLSRRWRTGLAKMVRKLLPPGWESAKILDVGTGDGYTIRLIKPEGDVMGIDTDTTMEASAVHRGVAFSVGSAYQVPVPDASFDLVTCIEVVEHLDKPFDALVEVKRILRDGGSAVFTTPVPKLSWRVIWWFWTRLGPGKRWETTPHVSDLHMWEGHGSSLGLAPMLQSLGFAIEATDTCNAGYVAGVRAKKQPDQQAPKMKADAPET
jgi:ubiquinone/menaquinone biosynthesis C-methylase UbiE